MTAPIKSGLSNLKKNLSRLGVALCILLQGCWPYQSFTPSQIVGTWTRVHHGVREMMVFTPDFKFQQTVKAPDGETWEIKDTWRISERLICLNRFYMTFDDEKQAVFAPPKEVGSAHICMQGGSLCLAELDPYVFTKREIHSSDAK